MPSPHERARNNVRAGIFVTVSLALALMAVIVLTDAWQTIVRPTRPYTVTFEVSGGVKNLKPGAEVRVGGVLLGKVVAVTPRLEQAKAFEKIDVRFSVDQNVTLFADADVVISSSLIGADAWLDIPSVGTPAAGPPPNDRLNGISAAGVLTSLLGPGNAAKADQMVDDAARFASDLADMPQEYIVPILDDTRAATADVRALTGRIQSEDWPRWALAVDNVMTWTASATDQIDRVLAEGHGLMADSRAVVNDNREAIDMIVDNVHAASGNINEVTQRINEKTIQKVDDLLDRGKVGLEEAIAVIENVNQQFDLWAPEVREALASARLTAQQLKLASIEVRRSPWKLLYQPSRSEVEHELLYAAARSFALAASDVKAATESGRRLMEYHGDELEADPQTLQKLNAYLLNSLNSYEQAQQRLFDVLLSGP